VFFTNITGGICLPIDPANCGKRSMWGNHVYPYLKNWEMMTAPGETKTNDSSKDFFNISYGYNYGYMSTLCVANDTGLSAQLGCPLTDPGSPGSSSFFMGVNSNAINRAANIIMFADGGGKDLANAFTMGQAVNAPDAWPATKYFYGPVEVGWGKNCQTYFNKTAGAATGAPKTGKWGDTDGFAARYQDVANVIYVDSHSKSIKVGNAAAGTNFNPNNSCTALLVNDYSKYQWDPRFETGTQQ
jgi:hypothetical protein